MGRTVDGAFASFDEALNLDPRERLKAEERHRAVRAVLEDAGIVVDSFLQGSFARKTMLKPLKDIDIILLLHPDLRRRLMGRDGPGEAMEMFKPPLLVRWPQVEFDQCEEPAGKALQASFPDCAFTVDLVAGFDRDDGYVQIGDRHEGTWEPSNTRIQIRNVRERNKATGGRFVHQVRELKAFGKHHEARLDFVSGIVFESLAYACVLAKVADKHAVHAVLQHASTAVLGRVIEPGGDDDVTAKWTQGEREHAARVFTAQARRAAEALRLEEAGDVEAAIDVWHDVLGECFPAPVARPADKVMTAWSAGSVSSTGRPSTTRAGGQQSPPGRSWSSR